MRARLGLEQPERAIGLSAHDFAMLAAGPRVVLTRALKAEGAPTVASRWLQRLQQLTRGLGNRKGACAPERDYIGRSLGRCPIPAQPSASSRRRRARPCRSRPRRAVLHRNRNLGARSLCDLCQAHPEAQAARSAGCRNRSAGTRQRAASALELFVRRFPHELPAGRGRCSWSPSPTKCSRTGNAESRAGALAAAFRECGRNLVCRRGAQAARRHRRKFRVEIRGEHAFTGPAGDFTLYGRADRIDMLKAAAARFWITRPASPPSDSRCASIWRRNCRWKARC